MRLAVSYHGRVQGVGFRATTRHLARDLPVSGFVRNEPDGSVYLEVQGSADDVHALLARIDERLGRFIRDREPIGIPELEHESGFVIAT